MSEKIPDTGERTSDIDGVSGVSGLTEDARGTVRDSNGNVFAVKSEAITC